MPKPLTRPVLRAMRSSAWLLFAVCALTAGCERAWLNGFLDPSQVGRFDSQPKRREIRRTLSLLVDEPEGIPGSTEPTSEDLVPEFAEPKLGPGDVVEITIFELQQVSTEFRAQKVINEVGYISLPELGPLKVIDRTPRELELELIDLLVEKQKLVDPEVSVTLLQSQAKRFSVLGSVNRPGVYAIPRPDYRLLDAITDAGGVSPILKTLYVIRTQGKGGAEAPARAPLVAPPTSESEPPELPPEPQSNPFMDQELEDLLEPLPVGGTNMASPRPSSFAGMRSRRTRQTPASDRTPPAAEIDLPDIRPVVPPPSSTQDPSGIDDLQQALETEGKPQPWTVDPLAGQPTKTVPASGAADAAATGSRAAESGPAPIDWSALAEPESITRVIEIPIEPLMNGEQRYNIVIRPSDMINVASGPIGEFYVMGNTLRPGAYTLGGRDITVREAIAASGGFGPLATPGRAELIRRGSGDEEEIIPVDLDAIFAGTADNFYMRSGDILNVGTNALMPFIATFRNAFRMSYGFGFVYDRNFADIDGFNAQSNPKDRARLERAQRGFPL